LGLLLAALVLASSLFFCVGVFLLLLSPCLLCSSAVGVLVALLVPITTVPVMLSSSGLLLTLYTDLVSFDLPNHYLTRSMSVVFHLSLVF
jgi:hypothetical protein